MENNTDDCKSGFIQEVGHQIQEHSMVFGANFQGHFQDVHSENQNSIFIKKFTQVP